MPTTANCASASRPHIALITIARKLARRCYHTLRNAGDEAFAVAACDPNGGTARVHQSMICDQLPATLLLPAMPDSRPRTSGRRRR